MLSDNLGPFFATKSSNRLKNHPQIPSELNHFERHSTIPSVVVVVVVAAVAVAAGGVVDVVAAVVAVVVAAAATL